MWPRWLSRDPIEEQGGLNLYGYVLNDPVNMVDPLGQNFMDVVNAVAGSPFTPFVLAGVGGVAAVLGAPVWVPIAHVGAGGALGLCDLHSTFCGKDSSVNQIANPAINAINAINGDGNVDHPKNDQNTMRDLLK